MTFAHRLLPVAFISVLLAGQAAPPVLAQPDKSSAAAPASTSAPASEAVNAGQSANPVAQQGPEPGNASQQAYALPPDQLAKAIALNRIRDLLSIADSLWALAVLWLLLATRGAASLEDWAQRLSRRRWIQGAVFFAVFFAITELASLPLDWIGHHFERAYGISVQDWGGWLGDLSKAFGLTLLVGIPVLLLFNWIVKRWPRRYWLGAWVVTLPILVFSVFISPLVVPLFYKQEPLQKNHAALVAKLETLVARTGIDIPPNRMYLIRASEKSTGINAFVAGIGATKRYVMWDSATDHLPDDQILFVFGHESGHYVLHHIPKIIAGYAVALFFVYWMCAALAAWMMRRFGTRWGAAELSSRSGFLVLLFTLSIAGFLLQPAASAFSRHFEHQADIYGQEAIHGIVADPQKTAVAAFNALGQAWLEDPNPNPFIEFWFYSHPSTQHRAEFAMHYDPWANGGHGEFFKN